MPPIPPRLSGTSNNVLSYVNFSIDELLLLCIVLLNCDIYFCRRWMLFWNYHGKLVIRTDLISYNKIKLTCAVWVASCYQSMTDDNCLVVLSCGSCWITHSFILARTKIKG